MTGGWRDGDERFEAITGRRPMVEATLAALVAREPGVDVRRGVAVRGLVADGRSGVPRITGVVTDAGDGLRADLVVDAGGRRSMLPEWLAAVGARRPEEQRADSGYVCYARHYRSADGAMPPILGAPIQPYESLSMATLPADNGHWSVVILASARDRALRPCRDAGVWERTVRSYPLVAHWIDAEPVTGIDLIAKVEDRVRRFDPDDIPVATGIVALGDAAACTSPSVGRGASIALMHAVCLRDVLRDAGTRDSAAMARHWYETSRQVVEPYVTDTLAFDRHRRAQIEAQIAGDVYETPDPGWNLGQALMAAAPRHPDLLRGAMSVGGMLARGVDVMAQPGVIDAIQRVGPVPPLPGPSRGELLDIVAGASSRGSAA